MSAPSMSGHRKIASAVPFSTTSATSGRLWKYHLAPCFAVRQRVGVFWQRKVLRVTIGQSQVLADGFSLLRQEVYLYQDY